MIHFLTCPSCDHQEYILTLGYHRTVQNILKLCPDETHNPSSSVLCSSTKNVFSECIVTFVDQTENFDNTQTVDLEAMDDDEMMMIIITYVALTMSQELF